MPYLRRAWVEKMGLLDAADFAEISKLHVDGTRGNENPVRAFRWRDG
jgi:hypothetical protein